MTLIFGVVFFVLVRFGFPVITGMVRRRKDYIADSLREAEEARKRVEGVEDTCRDMLKEARREQEQLLDQARRSARQIVDDARNRAASEASEIFAKAQDEIEVQKREALVEIKNEVARVSVAVSEKILRDRLSTDDAQKALVRKLVDETRQELS